MSGCQAAPWVPVIVAVWNPRDLLARGAGGAEPASVTQQRNPAQTPGDVPKRAFEEILALILGAGVSRLADGTDDHEPRRGNLNTAMSQITQRSG